MSPFQFLLSKRMVPAACDEFFTIDIKPTWEEAFSQCENYRRHLDTLPIDPKLKVKSYLLKTEDITKLLNQGGGLDAMRIYIGHEKFGSGHAVRLFMVGCKKGITGNYEDWQIPPRINPAASTTELGESRPCPDECGSSNDLNQP